MTGMPPQAEHVGVSHPNASEGRGRRNREVTFPTAVVDLRPVAAGFDNALAWLARVKVLRPIGAPVARWTRRLIIHVHQVHRQVFAEQTSNEYTVWSLWLSNGGDNDAPDLRFQTRWNTDSTLFNVKTEAGLWLGAGAWDTSQRQDTLCEATDLNSHGRMRYAGLAVKYTDDDHAYDDHAYIVSSETLHRFTENTTWRWPSQAIGPGLHFVDIAFRSGDGGAAIIRLKVMNPGRNAPLKVHLSTGQLVD